MGRGPGRSSEVTFVACLDANGLIVDARVVARGTVDAVLALPGIAVRGELLLHNHPSGVLEPSGADLSVAARLHDGGVGFAIVDNEVTDCYVVVECPRPRATTRIDPIDVAALLSPSGPVARALGSFEDRPSQRDMAAYVSDLYNDGGVGMLEAGSRGTRCSRTRAGRSSTASRRGPPGRATARSPISPTSRAARCGTRWRRSRICAPGSSAPTSTAASCSRRDGARQRRTSWS